MPKLAAFPKLYLNSLCDGSIALSEWIELASKLDIEGLEFYSGFTDTREAASWERYRGEVASKGMTIPMLCCSPDFTHPDRYFRVEQVAKEKGWIDMAVGLGAGFCRVLSGQRRPELSREEGLR